jgi:hypothetical protein
MENFYFEILNQLKVRSIISSILLFYDKVEIYGVFMVQFGWFLKEISTEQINRPNDSAKYQFKGDLFFL